VIGHAQLGRHGQGMGSVSQQVHDGDTVTVEAVGNVGVRFLGVDAPEVSVPLPGRTKPFVAVPVEALADHGAGDHVQCREQGRGGVPLVVMGHGACPARFHGQAGLGAVQCLDLRFFVHAQHHGLVRRVEVAADDIDQLFLEPRVGADLGADDYAVYGCPVSSIWCEPNRLLQWGIRGTSWTQTMMYRSEWWVYRVVAFHQGISGPRSDPTMAHPTKDNYYFQLARKHYFRSPPAHGHKRLVFSVPRVADRGIIIGRGFI
jgi:hypothetical protein